jgi:endoglucanase
VIISYILTRVSSIALHSAGEEGGAQNYPQCFNLQVTGSGTDGPAGVLGTKLYNPSDAGILVNIYTSMSTYVSSSHPFISKYVADQVSPRPQAVPGPTLYSGAVSIKQATSAITATGTPITGSGSAATATSAQTTAAGSVSTKSSATAVQPTTVATTKSTATTVAPTTVAPTTVVPTTLATITTRASTTTAAAGSGATQSVYGQCGGSNWSGATACNSQATCSSMNPYYSQCVPTAA